MPPKSTARTLHDRLFKEFLHRFLPEFLILFFPEQAARLDFATLTFPEKEFIVNLPEQALRISDVVADVETLTGEGKVIVVHVEVEARDKKTLPHRMFEYYSMLRILRQLPVLPLALVLVPGTDGLGWHTYTESLFGEELISFRYGRVGLRDLPSAEYVHRGDPIAATLAALMESTQGERAVVKLTGLRTVIGSEMSQGDKMFLINLMQIYLPKEEIAMDGVSVDVRQDLADIELSWGERFEQRGKIEGKRELLLRQLAIKFGELPSDFVARLNEIETHEILDRLSEQLLASDTLAEMTLH